MHLLKRLTFVIFFSLIFVYVKAEAVPEKVLMKNIASVRLHTYGDQMGLPILKMNSSDRLELHFDDLEGDVKNYYYTFQWCDYNWQPVNLSPFDYIKGFTQQRISNYRFSSIAFTRYTHYQAYIPDNNISPAKSGNYLLKVYLDGDTTKLAFTRCFYVLESKSTVAAQIIQPFTPQYFKTHQRIKFSVNVEGINTFNAAQQVKVVVMQNNRWDNLQKNVSPAFIRGNTLDYNMENKFVFPGGKEWRWLDLRSLRLQSDRVEKAVYHKSATDVYVKPDYDRSNERYIYYQDLNGWYQVVTYESINPYWQGDYATVYFSYRPSNMQPVANTDVYIYGQMSDYQLNDSTKMIFNPEKGLYEKSLFLKQGYYSYTYLFAPKDQLEVIEERDGNNFEAENSYTVFIYYKGFADRNDQLIGVAKINTRSDRAGYSF